MFFSYAVFKNFFYIWYQSQCDAGRLALWIAYVEEVGGIDRLFSRGDLAELLGRDGVYLLVVFGGGGLCFCLSMTSKLREKKVGRGKVLQFGVIFFLCVSFGCGLVSSVFVNVCFVLAVELESRSVEVVVSEGKQGSVVSG